MRYVYFEEATNAVSILPEESTTDGVLLGRISDEDFVKVPLNFLLQSLFDSHHINRQGVESTIFIGPSPAP